MPEIERGEALLTHTTYEALGGLEGAIAKRADEIVAGLPAAAQAALPRVLRALTTVTGTTDQAPVARSASLEKFVEGGPALRWRNFLSPSLLRPSTR